MAILGKSRFKRRVDIKGIIGAYFFFFFDWIKNIFFEDSRSSSFYIWFFQQLGYTPLWIYSMELSN